MATALALLLAVFFMVEINVHFRGHYEGIFLLKGKPGSGKIFEVADDVLLGDGSRYIFGIDVGKYRKRRATDPKVRPSLYYEWDEEKGRGFVRNFLAGGGRLLTCFSRFDYAEQGTEFEEGRKVRGLFVGGGLPAAVHSDDVVTMNETGMAYNDGKRWYHLWCSVNEGIASARTGIYSNPSQWEFLGSKVLNASRDRLSIKSIHGTAVDGVPLRIERNAYFRAGKPYFFLSISVQNIGGIPVNYIYSYGDEPWVGDFGSSAGNVGWVKDGLIENVRYVDTGKYNYAGFYDYGNPANGAKHNFTGIANFIQWLGNNKPKVYFSNGADQLPDKGNAGEPLCSNTRFIGLIWGPKLLMPGEREYHIMAIGMAVNDPKTGFPIKPDINPKYIPD